MRSFPMFPAASLLLFAAVSAAAASLSGCYVEVGTDGDETAEDLGGELDQAEPEPSYACDIQECESFCYGGGKCSYDEGEEQHCVNDCLDACDDGWADDGDDAIMSCMAEHIGDVWCDAGLLDKCCSELDGWSDFCE